MPRTLLKADQHLPEHTSTNAISAGTTGNQVLLTSLISFQQVHEKIMKLVKVQAPKVYQIKNYPVRSNP